MGRIRANGIEIEYETFGDPAGRPLLLINGLADQLIHWGDDFPRDLIERGHYVIAFDNRDAGLSTKCGDYYTLEDMADDAAALLDGLGIGAAHVVGASMGGMIAQTLAIRHPARVSSLSLIYTHSGRKDLPPADPDVMALLVAPAPQDRDGYVDYMMRLYRALSGKGSLFDEAWTKATATTAYDRSFSPKGTARQMMAIQRQEDRRTALAALSIPVLIIHGTDDPLVPVEAAVDLADTIPGAELMLVEGMGHDLTHGGSWPRIAETISRHTAKTAG